MQWLRHCLHVSRRFFTFIDKVQNIFVNLLGISADPLRLMVTKKVIIGNLLGMVILSQSGS
jgi:hypothetical protein